MIYFLLLLFGINNFSRPDVINLYNDQYLRQTQTQSYWNGNTENCEPGFISPSYQQATLNTLNYFREMSGVQKASIDDSKTEDCTKCALIMYAEQNLSHVPDPSWACWTQEGYIAAGGSDVALTSGPVAMKQYIDSWAHRSWTITPNISSYGIGSVGEGLRGANCLWVFNADGNMENKFGFVAWPPPGYVPYDLIIPNDFLVTNEWTFAIRNANFNSSTVEVKSGSSNIQILEKFPSYSYGDATLVFRPNIRFQNNNPDKTYTVKINNVIVDGISKNYTYNVTLIDPGTPPDFDNVLVYQQSLATDQSNWQGIVLGGSGEVSTSTSGLCMKVYPGEDPGSNLGFVSNTGIINLVDNCVYKCSVNLTTDQTTENSIPYFDIQYNNPGNVYGGLMWLLDVAGGATGIGRFQNEFTFWMTPNSFLTPQWKGLVSPTDSAFNPSTDHLNDFYMVTRVLHDNSSINTQVDSGTICVRSISVNRINFESLQIQSFFNPPISSYLNGGVYFRDPEDFGIIPNENGFNIDESNNTCQIYVPPNNGRKSLVYYNQEQGTENRKIFPISWERDSVYLYQASIRALEEQDPIDIFLVNFDVPTSEFGTYHYTSKGSIGNFYHASSPRFTSSYYSGIVQLPEPSKFFDSNVFRSYVSLLNSNQIGTDTDGINGIEIQNVEIYRVLQ